MKDLNEKEKQENKDEQLMPTLMQKQKQGQREVRLTDMKERQKIEDIDAEKLNYTDL